MVYAGDLKSPALAGLWVRIPLWAPTIQAPYFGACIVDSGKVGFGQGKGSEKREFFRCGSIETARFQRAKRCEIPGTPTNIHFRLCLASARIRTSLAPPSEIVLAHSKTVAPVVTISSTIKILFPLISHSASSLREKAFSIFLFLSR